MHQWWSINALRKVKVKSPLQACVACKGDQKVKAPRFIDTRNMKVVKSVTPTHRPLLPPGISWYSFLEAESTLGTRACRMLRKKIPSDTTGDRSRDLPTSASNNCATACPNYLNSTDQIIGFIKQWHKGHKE